MEPETSAKPPIEERVKEYLNNPKTPPLALAVGQIVWRGVAALSNIDFIVSVREERIAMILEWLLDWGWIVIAVVAALWAFFAPRKSQEPNLLSWQRVGVMGVLGFMAGILVTTQGGTSALSVMQSWGATPTDCFGQIDTSKLIGFKGKDRIVLICGIVDAKVDPVSDTRIAVSAPFTINGGSILIDAANGKMNEAIDPLALGTPFVTWHSVGLLPVSEETSEVKSVSDIETRGGIILTEPKAGGYGGATAKGAPAPQIIPTAPSLAAPPTKQ
jgi:hypothetical protein